MAFDYYQYKRILQDSLEELVYHYWEIQRVYFWAWSCLSDSNQKLSRKSWESLLQDNNFELGKYQMDSLFYHCRHISYQEGKESIQIQTQDQGDHWKTDWGKQLEDGPEWLVIFWKI